MKGQVPGPRFRHSLTPLNGTTTKEYLLLGGEEKEKRKCFQLHIFHSGTPEISPTEIDFC